MPDRPHPDPEQFCLTHGHEFMVQDVFDPIAHCAKCNGPTLMDEASDVSEADYKRHLRELARRYASPTTEQD